MDKSIEKQNLKALIDNYRKDKSRENYHQILDKLAEMYNNESSLIVPGHIYGVDSDGIDMSFVYKIVMANAFMLCFTDDSKPYQGKNKDYTYASITVRKIFSLASGYVDDGCSPFHVSGLVLNDEDGKENVFVCTHEFMKYLKLKKGCQFNFNKNTNETT